MDKDSVMYTDGFRVYDGLVDWGYKHHYRVNHGNDEFVEKEIDDITKEFSDKIDAEFKNKSDEIMKL